MSNIFPTKELKERLAELEEDLKKMESYRFSEDEEFASKLKGFFSHQQFRRSGRTFLLLRILIESSIENDSEIALIDHFPCFDYRHIDQTKFEVRNVVRWYAENGVHIQVLDNIHKNSMKFILSNGYHEYTKIRINSYVPKVQEERQFSKLLLIL